MLRSASWALCRTSRESRGASGDRGLSLMIRCLVAWILMKHNVGAYRPRIPYPELPRTLIALVRCVYMGVSEGMVRSRCLLPLTPRVILSSRGGHPFGPRQIVPL